MPRWLLAALARAWAPLLVALLALLALAPLLARGLPRGHDALYHYLRLVVVHYHAQHGTLLPRWLPELALGFGYPLFNYYSPAAYVLPELLVLAGLAGDHAWVVTAAVLMLAAGLGQWWLARAVFAGTPARQWAALLAAAAYLFAPYVLIDLYQRAAWPELAALALLPWLLGAFRRVLLAPAARAWWLPAVLLLAALAATHTSSLLLALPALLGGLVVWAWRRSAWARPWRRLAAAGSALAAAAALSAFAWLPQMGERAWLAPGVFASAADIVQRNLMAWPQLVQGSLRFQYSHTQPFPLGLLQVGLAVAGWVVGWWVAARHRRREWAYWGAVALGAVLALTRLAAPLWARAGVLNSVQFAWRLEGVLALCLALLTGALALGLARLGRRGLPLAGAAMMAVVVAANYPRMPAGLERVFDDRVPVGLAEVSEYEEVSNNLGTMHNWGAQGGDFMPRWVEPGHYVGTPAAAADHASTDGLSVTLTRAGPFGLEGRLRAERPAQLRLSTFYFPGWRFVLDTDTVLPAYASTALGVLTVEVPAGEHTFSLAWVGTPLQRWAGGISLAALAGLAAWAGWGMRQRALALALLAALVGGSVLWVRPAGRLVGLHVPAAPLATAAGVELLGYRTEFAAPHTLHLFPYWHVRQPPWDFQVHWQLWDASGQPVAATTTRPLYDSLPSTTWPAGMLVDDAYALALPPNLAAGDYALTFCIRTVQATDHDCGAHETYAAGPVTLPARTPPAPPPAYAHPLGLRFGQQISLSGYSLRHNQRPANAAELLAVRPGDELAYTLYWRGQQALRADLHGFVHLVGAGGDALLKHDDRLGPELVPPRRWDPFYDQPDTYRFVIPPVAASQLYATTLGVYDAGIQLLPITDAYGAALDSRVSLGSFKVLPAAAPQPQHAAEARFGQLAAWRGYDLALPPGGLRAGETLTLTLYYQAQAASAGELTRFVHLHSPALGLAAQADGPPAGGANPTTTWLPGEHVVETVTLTLDPAAAPGAYDLWLGFYDAAAGLARLPVFDAAGQPLPNGQVLVTQLVVE